MAVLAETDSTGNQMKTLRTLRRLSQTRVEILRSMSGLTKCKAIAIFRIVGILKVEETTMATILRNGSKVNPTIDLTIKGEGIKISINSPTPPILIAIVVSTIKISLIEIPTKVRELMLMLSNHTNNSNLISFR